MCTICVLRSWETAWCCPIPVIIRYVLYQPCPSPCCWMPNCKNGNATCGHIAEAERPSCSFGIWQLLKWHYMPIWGKAIPVLRSSSGWSTSNPGYWQLRLVSHTCDKQNHYPCTLREYIVTSIPHRFNVQLSSRSYTFLTPICVHNVCSFNVDSCWLMKPDLTSSPVFGSFVGLSTWYEDDGPAGVSPAERLIDDLPTNRPTHRRTIYDPWDMMKPPELLPRCSNVWK